MKRLYCISFLSQKSGLDNLSGRISRAPQRHNSPPPPLPLPLPWFNRSGWPQGQRAPDLWVNVTLPVYMASQDIYLFWLGRCVFVCVWRLWCSDRSALLASPLLRLSEGDSHCRSAQFELFVCSLELLLHFTALLSSWLQQSRCSLWRRQDRSAQALFLEASSLTVKISLWWKNVCELECSAETRWCYQPADAGCSFLPDGTFY